MKLIGSKTEQDFRDALVKSKKSLFEDKNQERLLLLLQAHFPEMKTAYFINHIPDQEEDFYLILINTSFLATVEFNRYNLLESPIIGTIGIQDYLHGLSKVNQTKLAVAIDLAQKDLAEQVTE